MAAAFARHLFGQRVVAESAGVDAGPLPVSRQARTTLEEDYGITIGEQQARDVENVDLAEFDHIVALDHWIADELRDRHHVAPQRILVWSIADPYMSGRAEYAAAAECIKNELLRHEKELLSPLHEQSPAPPLPAAPYETAVRMLLERIASWRELLARHDPGPTHRSGIVTKAFDTLFVQAFRQRLSAWLTEQHMDAEAVKEKAGAEQALERSPLGTVVAYLKAGRKLNAPLADAVPPHAVKLLDRLPSLRNQLVKPDDYQAPTVEETLRALEHVEEALKAAAEFFMPTDRYAIQPLAPGLQLAGKDTAPPCMDAENKLRANASLKWVKDVRPPDAKGVGACPGAVTGKIIFSLDGLEKAKESNHGAIFVGVDVPSDQFDKLDSVVGLLTVLAGRSSHAAILARAWHLPCVAGCRDLVVDRCDKTLRIGDHVVCEGELITIDGDTGFVYVGAVPIITDEPPPDLE